MTGKNSTETYRQFLFLKDILLTSYLLHSIVIQVYLLSNLLINLHFDKRRRHSYTNSK